MNHLVTPVALSPTHPTMNAALATARQAAAAWATVPIAARLHIIRRARRAIARNAETLAATVNRPPADTIVAEILPLLEAMRFLERRARKLLAPRRAQGMRPLWLFGVSARIHREPLGAVLILGPGNYPLFLPGAQTIQALVAGNAVCLKPAPAGVAAAQALQAALHQAGLPETLLQILDEAAGPEAAAAGFDRIVLTGSAETGRQVLAAAATTLTPCTMELSGNDPVFVLPGADLALVAQCLAYGLRLNSGATCIAPRRIFVTLSQAGELEAALLDRLPAIPDAAIPPATAQRLQTLLAQARSMGARLHHPSPERPAILADAHPSMPLLQQDVFAPWLALIPVTSTEQALQFNARCPFALGASIFGPPHEAKALAARIPAGAICINDLIVPTADPRLPFGGSSQSGFGRTRGSEGLLEFTTTKTVSLRRLPLRPHLNPPTATDPARFATLCKILHATWPLG